MFTKIFQWIQEVFKMIRGTDVKQALKVDVAISEIMASALQTWSLMYANQAGWLNKDIKSLNLSAAIAGEIARAVTIEMEVTFSEGARAKYLAEQLDPIIPKLRQWVEYGVAKGGLVLKPYPDGKNIGIDCVQADQLYPVTFDANGNITACVFSDQQQVGNKYYTRLEYHTMTDVGCEIRNQAFRSNDREVLGIQCSLLEVDVWKDLKPEATITGIEKPLFGYFRYPMANNIDTLSPLGISCFARAAVGDKCLIQQADEQWSNLLWEFESGQRALYADVVAFGRDEDGKPVLPMKRLYRALNGSADIGDEGFFKEWSPSFREASILAGLEAILRRIEFVCGLAYGTLSNPETVDRTATELKISQQRSYATITDTQKALKETLDQLLYGMDTWATLNNLAPAGSYEVNYDFDDSVIVDKGLQFQQDMQLVSARLMSDVEFRIRNFGESEEEAKKQLALVAPELSLFDGGV